MSTPKKYNLPVVKSLLYLPAFIAVLLTCCLPASAKKITYYPGVYSLGSTDNFLSPDNYDSAYVAGGAVRVSWALLEPTEGVYDWSFIEHEMATADGKGKHISIFFGGAFKSPAWLLNDTAIHFFAFYDSKNHLTVTPLPYDSVYLSKLCRFISAFGARFRDSAVISYVRGASESVTQGWGLAGIDTGGRTLAGYYHYTTDTLLHAMQRVLDTFMAAFPYTPEWVEVGKLPFDTLGGHHNIYTGEQIAAYGFANYPNRFNVWREDFNACFPVPPDTFQMPSPFSNSYWRILWEHPCHNGAQAVWNLRDVSCTTVPRMDQCDAAQCSKDTVLWRAVSRALQYKMTYLEIYAADVLDLSLHSTLQKVADSLAGNAAVCLGNDVGVAGLSQQRHLWKAYPNPAADALFVETGDADVPCEIMLRDMMGRVLRSVSVSEKNARPAVIDLRGLPAGLYLLGLRSDSFFESRKVAVLR